MHSVPKILCVFAALALAACQQMLESDYLATAPENPASCGSNAGTYHLPRRLVVARVKAAASPQTGYSLEINPSDIPAKYVADRDETYCLDFLLSQVSTDRVGVQRNDKGLLERIYTKAIDRTPDIVKSSVQAAADLYSSNLASLSRSARPGQIVDSGQSVIAYFEFDPFVEREAREVNFALSEFGYCLFLDSSNDPFAPRWSRDICEEIAFERRPKLPSKRRPQQTMALKAEPAYPRSGLAVVDPKPVSREWQQKGILYRPELSHSLVVLRQKDPGSRTTGWWPVGSERVLMPNASPAFVLEIKRAAFVTAETDVRFTNGLIKNVTISKPSELYAFADLTVAVAQIIVGIPARSLAIYTNRADNTEALIRANTDLITTLRQTGADISQVSEVNQGTSLILNRSATTGSGRSINPSVNPASARFAECLRDPATQQYDDPVRVCQELVNKNL